MDTLDKVMVSLLIIACSILSTVISIYYIDKKICELKGGIPFNGECVEVIRK